VALTDKDRILLERCLQHKPGAWNDFVDRFLGSIYHVIRYTAHLRSVPLAPEDVEDLAAEVLLQIVAQDYRVLREFRRQSSLFTYLTVIARRICVNELAKRHSRPDTPAGGTPRNEVRPAREPEDRPRQTGGLESLEEVARLLRQLPARERAVVRMFYLEGRTYEEISTELNIPVNSIGPILSRAKRKLRGGGGDKPARPGSRPGLPVPTPLGKAEAKPASRPDIDPDAKSENGAPAE
jgi:RNA polymerase sigma-70 factor (ECF subfamily)